MKRAEIARVIGQAELAGAGFYVPLLRRVMQGEVNACWPQRDTVQLPFYRLGKKGRPLIVIVGDDDYRPAGPDTWACAAKVRDWAAFLHERSPKLPFMGVLPPDGAHPVMPARGGLH